MKVMEVEFDPVLKVDIAWHDYTGEYTDAADARTHFAPDIRFTDAPDEVAEGWLYNAETDSFSLPELPEGFAPGENGVIVNPDTNQRYDLFARAIIDLPEVGSE